MAPTRILSGPVARRTFVSFTRLSMGFAWEENATGPICVPEPGAALLLAAGAGVWLSALRRRAT